MPGARLFRSVKPYAVAPKDGSDPRITPTGCWLRATSLDELPQLVNVLKGGMSFVGPRPEMPFIVDRYDEWQRRRLSVRPGITGLWQICRSDNGGGDFHQWIYYDILYARKQSLWLDVKIRLATLWTMGGRRSVSCVKLLGPRANGNGALQDDGPTESLFYVESA